MEEYRNPIDVLVAPSKERELFDNVVKWGFERGIDNPRSQFLKLYEECAEAYQAYQRGEEGLSMELGDIIVVTTILADILELDILDCFEQAYDKIKHRTGVTHQGNFIKEEDLR